MEDDEIDNERGVIVEEDRQRGKNAQSRILKELLPVLLHGSRLAERIPIGKLDIIQHFKHDQIRQFYKDWYRPELQGVIAVGDFDVAEVESLIKQNFNPLKNPASPRPRQTYSMPDNKEPLVKVVTDKEFPFNVALVTIRHHGNVTKTTADMKFRLIQSMINSMMSSRITELKQKGNAPFVEGQFAYGSYQGGLIPGLDAATLVAVSKTGDDLAKALGGVMAEGERMSRFGFTASELEVVKKNMEASNDKGFREKDKTPSVSYVQSYLNNFMQGSAIPSATFRYETTKKLLNEITLDDVNKFAKNIMKPENMIVVVQAPEKEKDKLPTPAQLLETIRNAGKGVTAYVDNTVKKPLLEKKPAGGKVVSEEKMDAVGVTKLTLSNGVKVYLKPTDFKNDQILFTSFAQGGTSLIEDRDVIALNYADNIAGDGIGEFDNTQLRKVLAGTTAGVSPYIGELYQGFSGSTSPKDLETAFQLIYSYAINPRKDPVVFKKNIDDMKVMEANANLRPESVYGDSINAVMTSNSIRSKRLSVEDIGRIDLDRSLTFYKDRFSDNSGQSFIFVGNFEVDKIKPLLETYLGGLPSTNRNEHYIDRGEKPMTGKISRTVYKGLEDKAQVQLFFHGPYKYSSENNMQLNALGDILEFKVLERLREKESGVYSPRASASYTKEPSPYYTITISFSCATANVDKLVNAALDEIEKIKKDGATAVDVEKFKAETKRSTEVNLRENNFWLGYLTSKFKLGEDPTSVFRLNERLEKVTSQSVKLAAQEFLSGSYFRAVLVPEKK